MSDNLKDARQMLIESSPELAEFAKSAQYKHSRELMKLRYELSLDTFQAAKITELSHDNYVSLETGLVENIEEYKSAIYKLNKSFE